MLYTVDGCKKIQVEVSEVVTAVEMVNSTSCTVFVKKTVWWMELGVGLEGVNCGFEFFLVLNFFWYKLQMKHMKQKQDVHETAIHVFAMASCVEELGNVTFSGTTVWMNPYGHLPGDVYGYLPFYGWMCVAYLLVSILWFCMNAVYWKQLLYVQVKYSNH